MLVSDIPRLRSWSITVIRAAANDLLLEVAALSGRGRGVHQTSAEPAHGGTGGTHLIAQAFDRCGSGARRWWSYIPIFSCPAATHPPISRAVAETAARHRWDQPSDYSAASGTSRAAADPGHRDRGPVPYIVPRIGRVWCDSTSHSVPARWARGSHHPDTA